MGSARGFGHGPGGAGRRLLGEGIQERGEGIRVYGSLLGVSLKARVLLLEFRVQGVRVHALGFRFRSLRDGPRFRVLVLGAGVRLRLQFCLRVEDSGLVSRSFRG